MKLGAFDYLLKPIKLEELLKKIAQAIEKKRHSRSETTVCTDQEAAPVLVVS